MDSNAATEDSQGWIKRIERAIWLPDLGSLPGWKIGAMRFARTVIVLFRDLFNGRLTLWAMSLVYTTLLSMVPLLAVSVSVLKAFGVHNQVEPLLRNLLAPLGNQGQEISTRIVGFIENMNVGVLGSVGLALLVYTVVSMMQKIEESFNSIWRITQLRNMGERFSRYLSTLLVGPLLIFSALGITATVLNSDVVQAILSVEPLGTLFLFASRLMPYVLVIGAFTFFFRFVPNTRVRLAPALVAGTIAGSLWQSAGWAFALFIASSTQYSAIYSSFAVLILFLIWLYASWLILLFGVDVSFYIQHPEQLYVVPGETGLSNRMRERLALAIFTKIGSNFVSGRAPWTLNQLANQMAVPMQMIDSVLKALQQAELLKQTSDDPPGYLPGRDLATIPIASVLTTVRRVGEEGFVSPAALPLPESVELLIARMEDAAGLTLQGVSIKTIVDEYAASEASRIGEQISIESSS